jgi:beta-galactosidase
MNGGIMKQGLREKFSVFMAMGASLALAMMSMHLFAAEGSDQDKGRKIVSLSGDGWKFCRDTSKSFALNASSFSFNDSTWTDVEVPHDWAIEGPFDPKLAGNTGKLPWRGVGWYRRAIELPASMAAHVRSGAALWLEFDGVMADSKVYVNGTLAGGWQYGYMSFRVNIAPFVKEGVNILAVRADTRNHHSRWYPGAGIYRDVRLVFAPAVHVVPWSEFVTTPTVSQAEAKVDVSFSITNRLSSASSVRVDAYIESLTALKSMTVELAPGESKNMSFNFTVPNPRLWDVESPNLYTAAVKVTSGRFDDLSKVRFGIRTFEFTGNDGFHLNGRRVQIYGVNLHSDLGPIGMAFNRSAAKRQLAVMKEMGANALRTSHNACDPQMLDLCDEMGIIVWNECFDKWNGTAGILKGQNLEEYVEKNLRSFVRRDRNHPSVVVWSIGNEIPPSKKDGMTAGRFRRFRAAIRELDATRPVGIGCCHSGAVRTGMFRELDLSGWNYEEKYVKVHAKHPNKPVVYTESASAVSSYGSYWIPPARSKTSYNHETRELDAYEHHSAAWSDIADLEFARMERDRYCAGEFVWTGIDYLGEPTPYIQSRSSYFGICDLACLPKDRYWLYRSHWNKKAHTTSIAPHWNWAGREGKNVPVYVYTDGDEAELFLNGKSLGRRRKGQSQGIVNLAAKCRVSASSEETKEGRTNFASKAFDGNDNTRWCASVSGNPEWLMVDLGSCKTFNSVYLKCERSDKEYDWVIEVSKDGKNWREWSRKKEGAAQIIESRRATARYVRVSFKGLTNRWASVREFIVSESVVEPYRLNNYYDVCDRYRLRWFDVAYEPGELKVVTYKNGVKIDEATRRTASAPVSVRLTPENGTLPPDGATLCFVTVEVVDGNGTADPLSSARVSFDIEGPGKIVAVCNGDARGMESFKKVSSHPLYNGRASVVVRRNKGGNGVIKLKAFVEGLRPAEVEWK